MSFLDRYKLRPGEKEKVTFRQFMAHVHKFAAVSLFFAVVALTIFVIIVPPDFIKTRQMGFSLIALTYVWVGYAHEVWLHDKYEFSPLTTRFMRVFPRKLMAAFGAGVFTVLIFVYMVWSLTA